MINDKALNGLITDYIMDKKMISIVILGFTNENNELREKQSSAIINREQILRIEIEGVQR
ncbi:MAG: hypothetical protein ACP5NK_01885 [Thermoplasmata archaeon]